MSGKSNGSFARSIAYIVPVTPNDSEDLPSGVTRALIVGELGGDVSVVYPSGREDTLFLTGGMFHPMQVKRVKSTGTGAANIKAGY